MRSCHATSVPRALGLALGALLAPALAQANPTPFGIEVNTAIDEGLAFLRANQNGNGGISDGESGRFTGLAMLCLLEKRASADWNAPALGYAGMAQDDQERVRRGVAYCINNIAGFQGG